MLEETTLEDMKEATEDVDSEELLKNGVKRPSDMSKGVRTRSQKAKDLDHAAGGERLKRQLREPCKEADGVTGRKEVGHGARSIFSDDDLLWRCHNTADGNFWETVSWQAEKMKGTSHECGHCSVVESDCKEPKTHKEMLKRPEEERKKWEAGMDKEFNDFERRGVWVVKKKRDITEGRKLICSKWVHKLKRNGIHRS